jgi:hypothetical protein
MEMVGDEYVKESPAKETGTAVPATSRAAQNIHEIYSAQRMDSPATHIDAGLLEPQRSAWKCRILGVSRKPSGYLSA